jgi:hypothetical protein
MKIEVVGFEKVLNFDNVEQLMNWATSMGFTLTGYTKPSENPRLNFGQRVGMPEFKELCGAMNNGTGLRYETWEAYNFYST